MKADRHCVVQSDPVGLVVVLRAKQTASNNQGPVTSPKLAEFMLQRP